eukprot:4076589-Prymnesium_polylepis.1
MPTSGVVRCIAGRSISRRSLTWSMPTKATAASATSSTAACDVVPPAIAEVDLERQVFAAIFDGVGGEKRVGFLDGARDVLVL